MACGRPWLLPAPVPRRTLEILPEVPLSEVLLSEVPLPEVPLPEVLAEQKMSTLVRQGQ